MPSPAATSCVYRRAMRRTQLARWWFAATALAVFVGLAVQLPVAGSNDEGFFSESWERVLNTFAYFTIQSNLIVGVTTLLLAVRPPESGPCGRPSVPLLARSARLLGVVDITLTFVVFHAVLRDLQDLTGQAAFADVLLHSVSPVLCVTGWVFFGPRGWVDRTTIALSLVYLLVWGGSTLVRGELVGFYPYPFMDPADKGYPRVALNLVAIAVVFVALCVLMLAADRRLARRTASAPTALETA